jgi:hypothetical protein
MKIIDKRFETQVKSYGWYAILSRGNHLQAAADVGGMRMSLQRYVMTPANRALTLEEAKQVSFTSKLSVDRNVQPPLEQGYELDIQGRRKAHLAIRRGSLGSEHRNQGLCYTLGYDRRERLALFYDAAAYLLFENGALYILPDL